MGGVLVVEHICRLIGSGQRLAGAADRCTCTSLFELPSLTCAPLWFWEPRLKFHFVQLTDTWIFIFKNSPISLLYIFSLFYLWLPFFFFFFSSKLLHHPFNSPLIHPRAHLRFFLITLFPHLLSWLLLPNSFLHTHPPPTLPVLRSPSSLSSVIALHLFWLHLSWPWRARCPLLSPNLGAATLATGLNALAYASFRRMTFIQLWRTRTRNINAHGQVAGGVMHMHAEFSHVCLWAEEPHKAASDRSVSNEDAVLVTVTFSQIFGWVFLSLVHRFLKFYNRFNQEQLSSSSPY